jgi:hypothetical protein
MVANPEATHSARIRLNGQAHVRIEIVLLVATDKVIIRCTNPLEMAAIRGVATQRDTCAMSVSTVQLRTVPSGSL